MPIFFGISILIEHLLAFSMYLERTGLRIVDVTEVGLPKGKLEYAFILEQGDFEFSSRERADLR
jgi:hypothetical protein